MGFQRRVGYTRISIIARISDLKISDEAVEDVHRLCSCVIRAQGNLQEVDTQWVRASGVADQGRQAGGELEPSFLPSVAGE